MHLIRNCKWKILSVDAWNMRFTNEVKKVFFVTKWNICNMSIFGQNTGCLKTNVGSEILSFWVIAVWIFRWVLTILYFQCHVKSKQNNHYLLVYPLVTAALASSSFFCLSNMFRFHCGMSSVVDDVEELDALDARLLEALLELNKTLYWILFINFNSASSFSIDASLIVYGLYMMKLLLFSSRIRVCLYKRARACWRDIWP